MSGAAMQSSSIDVLHQGATLGDLFARAAARFAEREALVAGETRWTYAELSARVARMGAVLILQLIARWA